MCNFPAITGVKGKGKWLFVLIYDKAGFLCLLLKKETGIEILCEVRKGWFNRPDLLKVKDT
jgi:hypothetical protein